MTIPVNLAAWATHHHVSHEAMADLANILGAVAVPTEADGHGEAWAQSMVRLKAARAGEFLWRNNVGALPDANGRPVRYGLANESKAENERIKSSDLIGLKRVFITPQMVGQVIGQFKAREVKRPGWRYTGADREPAQLAFIQLVAANGGDAAFTTGTSEGTQ